MLFTCTHIHTLIKFSDMNTCNVDPRNPCSISLFYLLFVFPFLCVLHSRLCACAWACACAWVCLHCLCDLFQMVLVVVLFCSLCLCIVLSRSFVLFLLLFWFFVLTVLLRNIRRTAVAVAAADSGACSYESGRSCIYVPTHTPTQISFIQMNKIHKKSRRSPKEQKRNRRNFFFALVRYVFRLIHIFQFYVRFRFVVFNTHTRTQIFSKRQTMNISWCYIASFPSRAWLDTHCSFVRTTRWCIRPMLISWYRLLQQHRKNSNRIVQNF